MSQPPQSPSKPDESLIRDADLRALLDGAPSFQRDALVRSYIISQQKRDAEAAKKTDGDAKLAALPREKRRRAKTRMELEQLSPVMADIRHLHSVLAICGMPYDRQPIEVREYERTQGNMSLLVQAGSIADAKGHWVQQPLPFGPKARLILMHLCSEAIRQKSPTIEIADSFTAFVQEMGFSKSGGERGPLTAFREQLNALAACTIRISQWNGKGSRMKTFVPLEDVSLWLSDNPQQPSLWPSTVTFSPTMYESLKQHALPVNSKAVKAFSGSSRKLDLYFWLGWRLYNIDKELPIGWKALAEQFGTGFSRERDFRAKMVEEIAHLKEVFPKLPLTLTDEGLTLSPADPAVLALPAAPMRKKS